MPLTGWLMGRYGVVRTFVFSVLLFTLASFLCGMAWSLPSLIFFRVLQGAVSGPMIPGSQALLISIFPPQKRATALGIWSITTLVAPICGPILGGYISDNYHWGWIFLINVPVGLLVAFLCWRNLSARETPTRKLPIDRVGLGLLIVWVGALQVMLDTGKDADWFASHQDRHSGDRRRRRLRRLPDLGADRESSHRGSVAVQATQFCAGHAGLLSGLCGVLRQYVAAAALAADPDRLHRHLGGAGGRAQRRGRGAADAHRRAVDVARRRPLARHHGLRGLCRLLFHARQASRPMPGFWDFVLPLLVQGIAMSTFFVAMITISLDGVPPQRIPSASGISNFARITAGGFAASITTTLWDRREALHQSRLAEASSLYNPAMQQAVAHLHDFGFTDLQSYGLLARNLVQQAYLLASIDLFWISGWLSVAMIAVVWLARRSISGGGAHIAAD